VSACKFTAEERQIVRMVALGSTDRRIGLEMGWTQSQASMRLYRLRQEMGFCSRAELAAFAFICGLVTEKDYPFLLKNRWRVCADN
jgi:DNA-binding NarL/FixJ family response regulator